MRYPLQPLIDRGAKPGPLQVSGKQWRTYLNEGLTEEQADRLAVRMQFLPSEIWPEWADNLSSSAVLCDECGEPYAPRQANQRFCSAICGRRARDRVQKRRRYQTDPEWRERRLAATREWREQSREYVASYKRRRYLEGKAS